MRKRSTASAGMMTLGAEEGLVQDVVFVAGMKSASIVRKMRRLTRRRVNVSAAVVVMMKK